MTNNIICNIFNDCYETSIVSQGCKVVGVDLSTNNVKKAKSFLKEESSTLQIEFHEGNFFNLEQDLLTREYTHVWAQVMWGQCKRPEHVYCNMAWVLLVSPIIKYSQFLFTCACSNQSKHNTELQILCRHVVFI